MMRNFPAQGVATPKQVADLQTDVGDASASALGSLYGILGNPAQTVLAMIGFEGATALANKLTAARAALIDQITAARMGQLDPGNIPATLAAIVAYVDELETRLTAVRAGYLDNINQAGLLQITSARAGYLDNLIGTVATGTYSLPNDTNEHDALTFGAATQLVDIELDMNNLAQNNTVREYAQVNGSNYRQVSAKVFPTDFDTNTKAVIITFVQKNAPFKITLQAAVAEGSAKDVPYRYITRDLV
jgi:hypothetical protein